MMKIVVLFLLICLSGCSVDLVSETDVIQFTIEELIKMYDVSMYPGNPRVVKGFIEAKESSDGPVYVVNTWESDAKTAMELQITDSMDVDEITVYCLLVDNTTTCDYMDDVMVKYWVFQKKRR